jgi:hypothetical protein
VRVFEQPACMSQINKQTIDGLNAAQDALDTSEVDCSCRARVRGDRAGTYDRSRVTLPPA